MQIRPRLTNRASDSGKHLYILRIRICFMAAFAYLLATFAYCFYIYLRVRMCCIYVRSLRIAVNLRFYVLT